MKKTKVFLEQTPQYILNIIDALTFYRENAVMPKYRELITKQINNIYDQLTLQKIELFINDKNQFKWKFGDKVIVKNKVGIIVGASDIEGCVKIAMVDGQDFKFLDVSILELQSDKSFLN